MKHQHFYNKAQGFYIHEHEGPIAHDHANSGRGFAVLDFTKLLPNHEPELDTSHYTHADISLDGLSV